MRSEEMSPENAARYDATFQTMSPENRERYDACFELMERAHDGQKRKYSGEDYSAHPFEVAMDLEFFLYEFTDRYSEDERIDLICAAFLHDVAEDCPHITEAEIEEAGGPNVLRLVKELTNPSKGSTLPRAERKRLDREHLKTVSREAKIIKLIDRACNLCDMGRPDCPKDFRKKYVAESRLLLEVIGDADEKLAADLLYEIEELEKASGS